MKRILIICFLLCSVFLFCQSNTALNFDTNIPDAENNWVILPKSENDSTYNVGFIYFDEYSGYTYRFMGELTNENGQLSYVENKDVKSGAIITRIGNLEYKVCKVSPDLMKRFNLPSQPVWLKSYLSLEPENDKLLNRASKINGMNSPQLALPILEKLYHNNFKTNSLYFEMAFSYNALKDYANAEKVCKEALDNKKSNDSTNKEYVYALLQQKKTNDADLFLTENLKSFKDKGSKAESMINMVAFNAHYKNLDLAEKWLNLLKKDNDEKYKGNIKQLEDIINKNRD
ncbi:tetratricopeptide repeat protein [Chryseobacterium sp. LAM-KRS1]|uniref:tetratricopeptide repeat protein n=1 Tax=Chryseobacterium sp. LAM-KRS1 TaxID=2715754 RepID=UPI00155322E9|nr:hypothetical protein [Chryseobacterium sp. LAM-KRS1]